MIERRLIEGECIASAAGKVLRRHRQRIGLACTVPVHQDAHFASAGAPEEFRRLKSRSYGDRALGDARLQHEHGHAVGHDPVRVTAAVLSTGDPESRVWYETRCGVFHEVLTVAARHGGAVRIEDCDLRSFSPPPRRGSKRCRRPGAESRSVSEDVVVSNVVVGSKTVFDPDASVGTQTRSNEHSS